MLRFMPSLRGLLKRARKLAESVAAPEDEAPSATPAEPPRREDPKDVLQRVKTKAAAGLKPEDRLVVIYATQKEREEVEEIKKIFEGIETELRETDLAREPQTAKQLAKLSGVMVPPYVFINGRHWGNRFDMVSLAAAGDLEKVVANRLDEISEEARRIGNVQESFSDEISVENLLHRWKLGHIVSVDDLDAWYEVEKDGTERFYYQGAPHDASKMPEIAEEIVAAAQNENIEIKWMLDPAVQV